MGKIPLYRCCANLCFGIITILIGLCLPLFAVTYINLDYDIRMIIGVAYVFFFTVVCTICFGEHSEYIRLFVDKLFCLPKLSTSQCLLTSENTSAEPSYHDDDFQSDGHLLNYNPRRNPRRADTQHPVPLNNLGGQNYLFRPMTLIGERFEEIQTTEL